MASKDFQPKSDLTLEKFMEICKKKFPNDEIYLTKLIGADFVIKRTNWTGLAVKFKKNGASVQIKYNGLSPAAWARLLSAGLIMGILYFTSFKAMVTEFGQFLDTAPELK